jgi:hypothetical protein
MLRLRRRRWSAEQSRCVSRHAVAHDAREDVRSRGQFGIGLELVMPEWW